MKLNEAKVNKNYVVSKIEIPNKKTYFRILELGLNKNIKISIKKKSMLKKSLLVAFAHSCFTLGMDIAKYIEVENG